MTERNRIPKQLSLRLISPKLYTYITEELQRLHNIHSYDLVIDAIPYDEGLEVIIRYGETFSHKCEARFTHKQIDEISTELVEFVKETGEVCREVLINDYFKLHAP
jgi:hypothetical protein